jgi:3-hexulose-6-phosphate synthase
VVLKLVQCTSSDAGADIVVAGAAIYGAADPAASAAEITGLARAGGAAAGGIGKFLPWILIAGAVLLGLYLLSGKKAEEMPAAADAAVEQVEGAAAEGAAAVEGAAAEAATAVEGAAAEGAAAVEGAAAEAATAVEAAKDAAAATTEAAPAEPAAQ